MEQNQRRNFSSESPFEPAYGFSRAVRVGNQVFVSGTTAMRPDGTMEGGNDAYAQAMATFRKIAGVLDSSGASMSDIVRTRIFLKNIANYDGVERAHREFFGASVLRLRLLRLSGLCDRKCCSRSKSMPSSPTEPKPISHGLGI